MGETIMRMMDLDRLFLLTNHEKVIHLVFVIFSKTVTPSSVSVV